MKRILALAILLASTTSCSSSEPSDSDYDGWVPIPTPCNVKAISIGGNTHTIFIICDSEKVYMRGY
jgi:hypothetical protein